MGNVLKTHRKTEVLTLVRAEHSFRDVAGRLGVRRETVSKYAREAGLWPPSKPATPSLEVATGFCEPDSNAHLVSLPTSEAFSSVPLLASSCSDSGRA